MAHNKNCLGWLTRHGLRTRDIESIPHTIS